MRRMSSKRFGFAFPEAAAAVSRGRWVRSFRQSELFPDPLQPIDPRLERQFMFGVLIDLDGLRVPGRVGLRLRGLVLHMRISGPELQQYRAWCDLRQEGDRIERRELRHEGLALGPFAF